MLPKILEGPVGHVVGSGELERLEVRLACDDDRVTARAECGHDDFGHSHPGLRRHQGGQRFVLDLLESTSWSASGRVFVGQQPPFPREPLRVLCIATQHPYLQ